MEMVGIDALFCKADAGVSLSIRLWADFAIILLPLWIKLLNFMGVWVCSLRGDFVDRTN